MTKVSRALALCMAAILLSAGSQAPAQAQKTIPIAVIGPMSGQDARSGQAMVDGVRMQAQSINDQGGIQGRRVRIEVFDNKHDRELARQQARKIAAQSGCAAVIGHYYSSLSLQGGAIYKEYGIPAVTGSAAAPEVTEGNDWYFRVISDNRLQGRLSALYLSGVLGHSSVSIVYEDDAYGRTLMRSFRSSAKELGLDVLSTWQVNSLKDNVGQKLQSFCSRLSEGPCPSVLYLALLDQESADFVRRIRDAGLDVPILGGDSLGLGTFPQEMASVIENTEHVGDYTHGIYATTYFIRDIANQKAQQFSREFIRRFGREPDALAATSFDAAGIVLQALAKADLNEDLATIRRQVRDGLHSFSNPEEAYTGVTGAIYFDDQGNAINPSPFGTYVRDTLVSAPIQLTPVLRPGRILDVARQLERGELLRFQDSLYYKTNVVYTGIDINEILHIDQKNEAFTADFYVWFRHKKPLDFSKIEFLNSDLSLGGSREPMMASTVDNMDYRAYRIKAEFREPFEFHHYPFDVQTLRIRLRHKELNRERLIFVADDIGMQRHKGSSLSKRLKEHSGFKGDNKWELKDIMIYADIGAADSTLGNPHLFRAGSKTGITYSKFNVVTEIKRNAASYMFKNMVPLFFIFLLGYAMSFIFPEGPPFAARLNLGVILLLTTVSLSLMTSNQLPNIGYLVTLDYMYFFVYFWLLLGILATIAVRSAYYHGREALQFRLEKIIRTVQPVLLLAMLATIAWIYG